MTGYVSPKTKDVRDTRETPKAQDFLTDEDFHSLSPKDQIGLLRKVDPTFAALPPNEQGRRINEARAKVAPVGGQQAAPQQPTSTLGQVANTLGHVGNFGWILGKDAAMGAPTAIYNAARHPLNTLQGMYNASSDQFAKAKQDWSAEPKLANGDVNPEYLGPVMGKIAAGGHLLGAAPILGPAAATAGEEIGRGDYGTGAAHGLEALMMGGPRLVGGPVLRNTIGRLPGVEPTVRAMTAGVKAAMPSKVSKVMGAMSDAYKGPQAPIPEVPIDPVAEHQSMIQQTRKVSRPARADGKGRTTDDLNPVEAPEAKQAPAPIDKSRMVKRGTTTEDLNPQEPTEALQKAVPVDKSKMVKRGTTTEDLNPPEPEKPLSPRMQRKADWEELQQNTRKVNRPAKSTPSSGKTTDDLNPSPEESPRQKPAPVDKGIVRSVERSKQLTPEKGKGTVEDMPQREQQSPQLESQAENSSPYSDDNGPYKPPISQSQIDAAQNEYRQPKANNYAKHLTEKGVQPHEVGNISAEEWKAHAGDTGEYLPSVHTIDKIKTEMTRLAQEKLQKVPGEQSQ